MTDVAVPRLSRSVSRRWRAVAVAVLGGLLLAGCGEVRVGSAAVVGGQRITDDQVQTLVEESLGAPGVREALPTSDYKGDLGAYRRAVLNLEVERVLAEEGARRLGVRIDESRVDSRYRFFEQQSGGAGRFASELASRLAVSPALYRQLVRTEVIESEIGYVQGGVQRPTEGQLRLLYQEYLPSAITATLSLIQLPDAPTARRVAAQLQADPESFKRLAARYAAPDSQISAEPQKYILSRLPQDLAARIQRAARNEVFAYTLTNGGAQGFFVISSGGIQRPTLESARPQLEAQTMQQASQAGQKYLAQLAREMGVDVNPRYGTWKVDQLTITDFENPVISPTPTPTPTATLPGTGDGAGTGEGSGGSPADPGASPTN